MELRDCGAPGGGGVCGVENRGFRGGIIYGIIATLRKNPRLSNRGRGMRPGGHRGSGTIYRKSWTHPRTNSPGN